jgi:hypothetical protein
MELQRLQHHSSTANQPDRLAYLGHRLSIIDTSDITSHRGHLFIFEDDDVSEGEGDETSNLKRLNLQDPRIRAKLDELKSKKIQQSIYARSKMVQRDIVLGSVLVTMKDMSILVY